MLRDVFYFGKKPNAHPRERHAANLEVARYLATTDHFWIINEFCDYTGFDWEFDFDTLPDDEVWTERHDNVWPSQHQKDSGTWLCNKNYTDVIYYRTDVEPVRRKNIKNDCWEIIHPINEGSFDFSWHPDPTEPPYIYRWGCKYFPATQGPVVQYTVPGATQFKYMDTLVDLVPDWSRWKILHDIELDSFDFCWAPDPASPPYIYVFGNQHYDAIKMPTVEYHMDNAEERKYVKAEIFTPKLKQHPERFEHLEDSYGIDYSWVPDPDSGPYIYAWGNQWNKPEDKISIQYAVQGATTYTYMGERAIRRPCKDNWEIPEGLDTTKFDFSWEPSPAEPPFIYQFGTQWQKTNGPRYVVKGATEIKYIDATVAKRLPSKSNWEIPDNIDVDSFDYSWHPDDTDPPFIYQFGTQHQKTNGPRYVVQGATEIKYIDSVKAKILPNKDNWEVPTDIDTTEFDYSWHPDDTETPYIYQFGTQHQKTNGPRYVVRGATEIKYVEGSKAKMLPDRSKFDLSNCATIDTENFDYSWHPDNTEVPYIYQFGTQHQKTGGPRYVIEGATEIKYVESVKATALVDQSKWDINTHTATDLSSFDFSWHPDTTEIPYIYQFGTQHQKTGGPRYIVPGATDVKYVDTIKAKAVVSVSNWQVDDNVPFDNLKFDFSWHPDSTEVPYIYQFGTQHQKTGGPRYVVPGATDISYVENIKALALPTSKRWDFSMSVAFDKSKFDFSWHPDDTDKEYIYVFGTQHQKTGGPRYVVPGATEFKYVEDQKAHATPTDKHWEVVTGYPLDFDYSWHPDNTEDKYIYVFGNQHYSAEKMPTVRYVIQGATEFKYINDIVATIRPDKSRFRIHTPIDENKFDYSWVPDPGNPPYVYVWGNKHVPAELGPTVEFYVDGAVGKNFVHSDVVVLPEFDRWNIIDQIDRTKFDFTWRPDPTAPPYIYAWGSKHVDAETSPAIEYIVPNATEYKFMEEPVEVLPRYENFFEVQKIDRSKFDFTWRPNPKEPPFIYAWGNKHVPVEIKSTLEYRVPGATDYKYMHDVEVLPEMDNWHIFEEIDKTKFDLSWRPDPREPAYIYVWGNKYVPGELQSTIEYRCPGATEKKYMDEPAPVLPQTDRWTITQEIDRSKFDLAWRPDPREPPFIYVWGNKYVPGEKRPTLTYHTPGATEYKYIGDVEVLPEWDRWVEHIAVDKERSKLNGFDFSWRPDPSEPPFIYVWGNKYFPAELRPTLEYHCDGASQKKYMSELVELQPNWECWDIVQRVANFDFSWTPDPREPPYIYVWGNKWISGEKKPTIMYRVTGATDYKYVNNDVEVEPEWDKWKILIPVDKSSFDFTWRPDPSEPPFVYVWGNQSNPAEVEPTVEYYTEGAFTGEIDQKKYMHDKVAKTLPMDDNWKILIPVEEFDFSWRPNPGSPPYIYVFGNQWNSAEVEPTVQYHVPGATEYSYVNDVKAKVPATKENWHVLMPVEDFDFSWRPNPYDPPYIYVFGNQWNPVELQHTIEYRVPGAMSLKYMDIIAKLKPAHNDTRWKNIIPIENFDYSWVPDPREPPLIYVFGNKWNDAATEPSVEYHMPDAYERKFMSNLVATPIAEMKYWSITNSDDLETFDFSWRPNPFSPPQIYQWEDNGPRYTVPGATDVVYMKREIKEKTQRKDTPKYYITTTLEDLIKQHSDEVFWALNPDMNYDSFDFSWRPNSENFRHINVFGSEYAKDTQTYYINGPMYALGYREYNYVEDVKVEATTTNLTMFYIDRGNVTSNKHFADLQKRYPNIIRTRYLNSWVDTINRCIRKSDTNLFWVLNSEYDYTDFKFNFYPSPWQMKMVHVFGTQWSHWGHTYLINGETFIEDTKYVRIIEHLNCLNFVKNQKAKATDCLYDIYLIDHGNFESSFIHSELVSKYDNVKVTLVPHRETYLETFKDILEQAEDKNENYIWITNSVCGYDDFDFSYICDPFAKEQLHVFPSDKQKYGDTFLVNVDRLREQVEKMISLDDYDKINFNMHQSTNRLEAPEIVVEEDTHTEAIQKLDFEFPYVILKTRDNNDIRVKDDEPISLWSKRSKTITVTTSGASRIIVPKEAKKYVKNELYDYPHIEEKIKKQSKPLDIVFLSNGETNADENYEHLLKITKGLPNRVVRVDGVNGRVQAYHAAAEASNTNWLFTVFAKLKVDRDFDFSWQPDRLRKPKHYIFQAKNPLNGLVYGHQAMIAYNKKLTLANTGKGLDFTLDDLHDSVEILSGVAEFNTDAYSTWRTAFREVIKLKSDYEPVSADRLKIWLSTAEGQYAQDCLRGARDAINYYNEVNGDIDQLKLSYEWEWLKEFYRKKYK